MRDPLEELESLSTVDLPFAPAPPSAVRRRGDRLRHRRNALGAIGGLAAVAVIAAPLAMAAGDDPAEHTRPADPAAAVSWVQQIPTTLPLPQGLPETNAHDGSPVEARDAFESQVTEICEGAGWTDAGVSDVRQATYTDLEGGIDRALGLYASGSAADAAFTALEANVQQCGALSETRQERWLEVVPSKIGDRSLVYVNHYTDAGDITVVQLVRVGNAILQDAATSLGGGDSQVVQRAVDDLAASSEAVVGEMCVFAADPC